MRKIKVNSKAFREICESIRCGQFEEIKKMEAFEELHPFVLAMKAEYAYFQKDFHKALDYDLELLPFWDHWYYSNSRGEHFHGMANTSLWIGREEEVVSAFTKEIVRLKEIDPQLKEGKMASVNLMNYLIGYIKTGEYWYDHPFDFPEKAEPKSMEELQEKILSENKKKIDFETLEGKKKLMAYIGSFGKKEDYIRLFEETYDDPGVLQTFSKDVTKIYWERGEKEKIFDVMKRIAKHTLIWQPAAATQVKPMYFFTNPIYKEFLNDEANLKELSTIATTAE